MHEQVYDDQLSPQPADEPMPDGGGSLPGSSQSGSYQPGINTSDGWQSGDCPSGNCQGDDCALGGCGACEQCCSGPRLSGFWGRAEYLYWFVRGEQTPALVTSSPVGTPQGSAGLLPGSSVLYGGSQINGQGRSGGRFTLGYWFDPNETIGIESTTLVLQQANTSYGSGFSTGSPILARPFANAATGLPDANLIAFPGLVAGQIGVASTTKAVGTEINFRGMIAAMNNRRTDVLLGYRFFRFDEGLEVATTSDSVAAFGTVPVGTTFNIHDTFGTRNEFNGGNLGLRSEWFFKRWSLDLVAKAAIGAMRETVTIQGNTVTRVPGLAPISATGGILALPQTNSGVGAGGNIGSYSRMQFAGIPEVDANLHLQISPLWRLNVGYSLLFLTNVVRPGNQIDPIVDPNRFPPPLTPVSQHPIFSYSERAVWMQGVNVGLEARF
ncbi:MAG TPA: BBP7 family outer membrane beta-barrel protein [Pirellulales bacterium]|nr:BBP7 family outer membrane beta-barrel protein [Pirellulales bacterium]